MGIKIMCCCVIPTTDLEIVTTHNIASSNINISIGTDINILKNVLSAHDISIEGISKNVSNIGNISENFVDQPCLVARLYFMVFFTT